MGGTSGKSYYVAHLAFPSYTTKPFRSELTKKQLDHITEILEKYKKAGTLMDYYIGPPDGPEWTHALVLSADALKSELVDLIEVERKMSSDR